MGATSEQAALHATSVQAQQYEEEEDLGVVGCWEYYAGMFGLCCVGGKGKGDVKPEDTLSISSTVASNESGAAPAVDNRTGADDSTVAATNQSTRGRRSTRSTKHRKTRTPTPEPPLDTSEELPKKPKGIRAVIAALSCSKKTGERQNQDYSDNAPKQDRQVRRGFLGVRRVNKNQEGIDTMESGAGNGKTGETNFTDKPGAVNDAEIMDELMCESNDPYGEEPEITTVVTEEINGVRSDLTDES